MDQNKNQGQQPDQHRQTPQQGSQQEGSQQQGSQQNWNQPQNPNRDPAEGSREQKMPGRDQENKETQRTQERGTGNQGERNSSSLGGGISNRGMDRDLDEQEDLPERGETGDESER